MNLHLPHIPPINKITAEKAVIRHNELTKPLGSLGRLEDLSIQIAGMTDQEHPQIHQKAVFVFAADHGVAEEGISAYPVEVTAQMVANIVKGKAAVSVLAKHVAAKVVVVDVGVAKDISHLFGVIHRKVAFGSRNLRLGPAMELEQVELAINCGMQVLDEQAKSGLDLVALGEIGIGNTTPAATITSAITGLPVESVTGRGTGLDDLGLLRKIEVIKESIRVNQPDPNNALDVLAKVGGLDIAGLVGVIVAAAARRLPIVLDGFITGAAAMIAVKLRSEIKPYLIASHLSAEVGHRTVCKWLGLEPLLDLKLRLGEGSGAMLAVPIIESAVHVLNEMATFNEAGVSRK